MSINNIQPCMAKRFRGFLPVVVDVETGGFNAKTDALLEIAAIIIGMDEAGQLFIDEKISTHITPFEGANIDPKSLEINGINPYSPLRIAKQEREALEHIFKPIRKAIKQNHCTRAILVGHNAFFDLNFLNATVERTGIKRNPFHPFSNFDTVSLCGLAYGQTVLSRAAGAAGINWESAEAHSAVYDAVQTAKLFCKIINEWNRLNPALGNELYTD